MCNSIAPPLLLISTCTSPFASAILLPFSSCRKALPLLLVHLNLEPTGALDSRSSHMLLDMLEELNQNLSATILMVTHDSFTASYCRRILFIKDGKIFNEIHRGTKSRKEFFEEIMEVVSVLGGETNDRG